MKRNIFILLTVVSILIIFSVALMFASGAIDVKDYIKGKLPSIFSFYLSSLEDLDSYEKEFIDLLEKLPEEKQEYYAKNVYKNGFSLELLKEVKDGKKVQIPTSNLPIIPQEKPVGSSPSFINIPQDKLIESLPSLIKKIKPSTVIIFTYDDKGEFLKLGSGFFLSQSGDVITNYHVIQGASSAEIKTADEKIYPITDIVAGDEQCDLICLSVNIPSQFVYPLSLSKTIPEVGERIFVYGSPLGLENTVSDGIVSAIRDVPDYGRIIQITAPISPGSSGSPVLNMQGEVIGIASFQSIEGQNLNFAIPSERISSFILNQENKISISKEDFGRESQTKKIQKSPVPSVEETGTYTLRDIGPAGGLIFYDKGSYSNGWRYLEAAPVSTEWTDKQWESYETLIGATGTGIGTGQSNTTIIATWLKGHSKTDCAAKLCDDLSIMNNLVTYNDWFLPSKDELNLMYANLKVFGVSGFAYDNYWSSSENSATTAWYQYLFNSDKTQGYHGYQYYSYKTTKYRVRAVRAF